MESDASGWLWLVIDVAMVAVLAIALIYGTMLWRQRRSRALQQASERARIQWRPVQSLKWKPQPGSPDIIDTDCTAPISIAI